MDVSLISENRVDQQVEVDANLSTLASILENNNAEEASVKPYLILNGLEIKL